MKILILGGTGEARELANRLVAKGHAVTSSLAGRTSDPKLPSGTIRLGSFGGIPGLAA
ncbi:MAG TPA: precorrin-6A/cobalt-precorrin-6A reductase, partial [Devosia sp.]|nr:precorrin-6A/cobalt-precorrin-6A reductase [Devosia sp.]